MWNAPIFFPYRDTLAFSENLLGVAVFAAPVYWATGNPLLAYNAAFVLSFTIAGLGMYGLARELTGHRGAAAIAGLYYAFCPLRMSQISHLQLVATGWIPVALLGLHRYFSTRRARWLAVFALGWMLQVVSNSYAGYFLALAIALVALDGLWRSRARVVDAVRLLAAVAAVGVILAPVGAAYYRVRSEYRQVRPREEIVGGEADLRSYVVGKNTIGVWRRLPTMVTIDPERELFPGLFAVALAACAFIPPSPNRRRQTAGLYLALGAAAIVLSLGPRVTVWGHVVTDHGPYGWLLRVVPGMDGMRVPARMAIVFVAALSGLIACGAARVLEARRPRSRAVATVVLGAAMVADGWGVPLTVLPYWPEGRPDDRAVARWLRTAAPGPVVHLPMTPYHEVELHHQFVTLFHRDPIVNGFSGYSAPLQDFLRGAGSPLRDPDAVPYLGAFLAGIGVRYVAVHAGDYGEAEAARVVAGLRASPLMRRVDAVAGATIVELDARGRGIPAGSTPIDARDVSLSASENDDRLALLVDGDADTRWIAGLAGQDGSSRVTARLRTPADVARVDLQFAERSWPDYPRRLRIDATDASGRVRTLYDAAPYEELGAALAENARYPTLRIALPANESVALTLRQTAAVPAAWSIHELRVVRR